MDVFNFEHIYKDQPFKGCLLIAEPLLCDPFFKRTVVFLFEHGEEGTMGFILNKPIDIDFNELNDTFPTFDGIVTLGGPVQGDNLYYMHTLGHQIEGSIEIAPGVYLGGAFEDLQAMILSGKIQPDEVRFFIGYSGWDKEQLDEEMEAHSWIVANNELVDLMDAENENLWEDTLKKMGKKFEMLTHFPEDPSLN